MKRWLKICAATFALALGLTAASTINANAKSFTYFGNNGSKTYHHKVISYQKYTLNKTYYNTTTFTIDPKTGATTTIPETKIGKVKFYHVYVFHVSPKVSRYQTWIKVTGNVSNYSSSPANAYWREYFEDNDDDTPRGYTQNNTLSIIPNNNINFDFNFSKGTSKSPLLLSKTGLAPGKSEGFQLLAHAKYPTSRLKKTTIVTRLWSQGEQSKELHLNLK